MRHLYDLRKPLLLLFSLLVTAMDCSHEPAPKDPFWTDDFRMAEIPSSLDGTLQKAYFFNPENPEPAPLLVSLHSWSGDYTQRDTLAYMARSAGWNYTHPDFRGRICHPGGLYEITSSRSGFFRMGSHIRPCIMVSGKQGQGNKVCIRDPARHGNS